MAQVWAVFGGMSTLIKWVGWSLVFEHFSEVMSHMISITMEVQQNEP